MKFFLAFFLLVAFSFSVSAQRVNSADHKTLKQKEDSLKTYARNIIRGINPSDRLIADSLFTKTLVRALKTKNSFYYPFDSLLNISRLYAPDSSFRIYTWQLVINENVIRQHGAIQVKTADGNLKLFGLIDKSDITLKPFDTISNHRGWIGAVYYNILQNKHQGKNIYTLLGYDENNIRSNKKIMEILSFVNGEPVFGGNYFSIANANGYNNKIARYIMEYKKESGAKLNYDPELDLVIAEHLVSETKEPQKKWTYISDGDFEGFKWQNGKWVHIENVRNYSTRTRGTQVPEPLQEEKIIPNNRVNQQ